MSVSEVDIINVCSWITQTMNETGKQNAVVGISGGIDSAVVASLCVRALGKNRVVGVILPIHSSSTDGVLANKLIENLSIDKIIVDHTEVFDRWERDLLGSKEIYSFIRGRLMNGDEETVKMMKANAKARMRMMDLYAVSAMSRGLVIGTTNKTEGAIGYFTKYGDGGVDIEPILDFYKTEIYQMAGMLGDIPSQIILRKPTAGLWDGQTDEEELQMSYEEIDRVLVTIAGKEHPELYKDREPKLMKVLEMIKNNAHKNSTPKYYSRGGIR